MILIPLLQEDSRAFSFATVVMLVSTLALHILGQPNFKKEAEHEGVHATRQRR